MDSNKRDYTSSHRQSTTEVCRDENCSFFGSANTEGYCSVCYQKELSRRKASISEAADIKIIKPKPEELEKPSVFDLEEEEIKTPQASTSVQEESTPKSSTTPKKQKKKKCPVCKKKLGLTGFECRCGKIFCALHRYSDKHECSFDYEKQGKDLLRAANPVVEDDKIARF